MTGGGSWVTRDRVVAVIAAFADGREQVGSGYLVSGRLVLTAAHCTWHKKTREAPIRCRVIRASDGAGVDVAEVIADPDLDVAVLRLGSAPWPTDLPAPVFAKVDRIHAGMLQDCQAIGFPLYQRDPDEKLRGTAELHGTIYQTDEAESGRLLMREPWIHPGPVTALDDRLPHMAAVSPWEGLSGALVFHRGLAIGVVVEHHPRQGDSALRAVTFDRLATRAVHADAARRVAGALLLPSAESLPWAKPEPVVGVPPPRAGGVRGAWPELPPNHVVRPELLGRLRAALLQGTGGGPRRVGVCGMGGSGKSVLAAALVQDRAVRRRFPDGLAWVRLEPPAGDRAARRGMLAQRQQGLAAKLTPAGQVAGEVTDVEQGRDRLAELLRDRACLVVVDNAWTADDVYAFSVLDRRGALLVTTRDAGLVRAMGAAEVEVAELSDAQAQMLAAGWAEVPEQLLPPTAAETLRLVGNLALGVATVAALARGDAQRWAELADQLRRAELAALELRFPGYPHPSLLAALHLGLDGLNPSDRRRYRELAVFAGRGAVPRPTVEALWAPAGVSAADAGDLLARFGDRALLRRDPVTGRVDLHDLQSDLVRADLGDSLPLAHEQLLAGYAARCPDGWPSGPDDGYFYQHLAGHLAAAGRREELAGLLSDVEWMRSRLRAGGVTGLLADYTTVRDEPGLTLVQATIRLSAHVLAVDPDQLPAQLAGRTIGRCEPTLARLHAVALAWPHAAWLCPIWPTLAQPGEALQQILTGHTDDVKAVAVSADGRTAVSGGYDGMVRVWDLAGTAEPRVLTGHDGYVNGVAVSADGRTAVSCGGRDGTVRVWDLAGTAEPRALTGHTSEVFGVAVSVNGVAVSADGRTAVSGGTDGTVRVWDLAGTAEPRVLTGHDGPVTAVAVSADGRTAVSGGGRDGTVRVWDLAGTAEPQVLTGHDRLVTAVAVSADGRTAVSGGGRDGAVRVWDLAGTAEPRVLTGHDGRVNGVAVSADGRTAVSGGTDRTVRVWDLAGTAEPRALTGHTSEVFGVAVSADGRTAVSGGGRDGTVRVWDLAGTAAPQVLTGHDGEVFGVAVSADGRTAVSGGTDGTVRVWDLAGTAAPQALLTGHDRTVFGVAVSADGRTAVSGGDDRTVRVWDLAGTAAPRVLTGHDGPVFGVAVSADGRTAVSGGDDGAVRVWDLAGTAAPQALTSHDGPVHGVAVSADGRTAVSGGDDGAVWVFDLTGTAEPQALLTGHDGPVTAVAVSADGRTAVSGGYDRTVRVWDLAGTAAPRVLTGHDGYVNGVAVSADGRTAVSGGDRTVRVWDLARDREQVRWIADADVLAVAFNAAIAVAGDTAGQVHALQLNVPTAASV